MLERPSHARSTIELPTRVKIDKRKFGKGKRRPANADYELVVKGDADCYENGRLAVVTRELPWKGEMQELLGHLKRVDYGRAARTGGMMTQSKTFGFMPRRALYRDCCTACALGRQYPQFHALLERLGMYASSELRDVHPEQWQKQLSEVQSKVGPEWRFSAPSLYTSGVINANHAVPYHVDGGNFKGSWNAMIVLQRDMQGGELVLPELRTSFDFSKPTLIMMDAQSNTHGVRNLRPKNSRAFRYSVVWYALSQLQKCMSPAEELARVRRVKTERAIARTGSKEEQMKRIKGGK